MPRSSIPKSADLRRWHTGTVVAGVNEGKAVTVKLFEGELSRGYQTDYERVPHRWIELHVGTTRKEFQFSGRNLPKALEYYQTMIDGRTDDGTVVAELRAVVDEIGG